MAFAMMAYNRVLNNDHEVCRGNSLQELMLAFEKHHKNPDYYYWIRRFV